MPEVLQVKKRDSRGKRNARRQRAAGSVPAILYGHGEESISLTVKASEVATALRHGSQVVDLQGDLSEQALIKEIQWDTFAQEVLHIDFNRVSAGERVTVTVAVELRGVAPGANAGGVVEQLVHELEIECPAMSIPEKLEVNINKLQLDESRTVADIKIPEGTTVLVPADTVVVQCFEPQPEIEEEAAGLESAEPEVIGRPAEEEESE
jgi:large subunit ribosomal protein L25